MDYQTKAEAAYRAVLEHFYVPEERLFRENYPPQPKDMTFSYLWPCIGVLSATNAMLGLAGTDQSYLPLLGNLLAGIEKYWKAPGYGSYVVHGGGGQRYYDDNAWLGIEFLDAYRLLGEQRLLSRTEQVFDFVVSGWSAELGGGLYWREGDRTTRNTCSNGPAAVLALKLYQVVGDPRYLDWAQRIYAWTASHLRSPQGVYWDSIDRTGRIDKAAYTYNSGIMIQAGLLLYQATGDERYLRDAKDLARSSLAHFASGPLSGKLRIFPPTPWFNAVLFRSYLALHTAVGDDSYAVMLLSALEYGWDHARDDSGLIHKDWSGRSGGRQGHFRLLDQAPVAEIFALAAQVRPPGTERLPAGGRPYERGNGFIATAWNQAGPSRPVLSPMGTLGNCRRFKERGIYAVGGYGEIVLTGRVYTYYEQHGGPAGSLGFPLTAAEAAPASRSGVRGFRQLFEGSRDYPPQVLSRLAAVRAGAVIYWTDQIGPYATAFDIGICYERFGGPGGPLGFPTSERGRGLPSPRGTEGDFQRFENGSIYWSAAHGAHMVFGAIKAAYEAQGGTAGPLGFPTSDVSSSEANGRAAGTRQRFEGGWIIWYLDRGTQIAYE